MNPIRGEIQVKIKGEVFTLVPDFEAIAFIDSTCGGVFSVIRRISERKFLISDFAAVVYAGIRSGGVTKYTLSDIGNAMLKDGMSQFVDVCGKFCARALNGELIIEDEKPDAAAKIVDDSEKKTQTMS